MRSRRGRSCVRRSAVVRDPARRCRATAIPARPRSAALATMRWIQRRRIVQRQRPQPSDGNIAERLVRVGIFRKARKLVGHQCLETIGEPAAVLELPGTNGQDLHQSTAARPRFGHRPKCSGIRVEKDSSSGAGWSLHGVIETRSTGTTLTESSRCPGSIAGHPDRVSVKQDD